MADGSNIEPDSDDEDDLFTECALALIQTDEDARSRLLALILGLGFRVEIPVVVQECLKIFFFGEKVSTG